MYPPKTCSKAVHSISALIRLWQMYMWTNALVHLQRCRLFQIWLVRSKYSFPLHLTSVLYSWGWCSSVFSLQYRVLTLIFRCHNLRSVLPMLGFPIHHQIIHYPDVRCFLVFFPDVQLFQCCHNLSFFCKALLAWYLKRNHLKK